jgi:hypothetical protein
VGAGDGPAQALDVHLEEATVAGLALEVAAHRRGPADERAVGEDLHGADPEPLVAPAGAKAEVETEAVGVRMPPLGELVLIVAAADDPGAGRQGRGARLHRAQDVLHAPDRRRGQGHVGEPHPEGRHVVVRVVEAGHHGLALEAHHPLRVEVAAQRVGVADRDDATAQHRERGRAWARGIHGEEGAALEDAVHAHGGPVTPAAGDRPRR